MICCTPICVLIKVMNNSDMDNNILYFIRFLKNEGVYRKFVNAFNSKDNVYRETLYGNKSLYEFLLYQKKCFDLRGVISHSFYWGRTKQGYCFWNTVSNKWESVYFRFAYGKK